MKSEAVRRFNYRFLTAMAFYVVFITGVGFAFRLNHPTGPLAYLLATLPSLPILVSLWVVGRYLGEEKDEFQRHLLVQAMIWAIGGTLGVTSVWGFLEVFVGAAPHFQLYLVFPMFWFFAGIAVAVLKLRYR
jgi:hypothetical protein